MSKAGRKKKVGAVRTASGRISRSGAAYQENVEPILTRMRLFGLSEADARDQKASTFVGRLRIMNVLSQPQYEAAVQFFTLHDRYKRAIAAPDGFKSSGGAGGGEETDSHAAWCRSMIVQHDKAIGAVRAEQNLHVNRGGNLYAALDYVVCRDEQMWHMVGDARLALNALAHHFGIVRTLFAGAEAA